MKKAVLAGIDVSAAKLDVAMDRGRGPLWEGSFENTSEGHRRLVKVLRKKGGMTRVCVEATGVYHLEVALALHGAAGVEVMVANPRATKDFARAQMQRSKTDRTDARSLLEFVRRMDFEGWEPPAPEFLALRALARHIEALVSMGVQEKNRDHAVSRIDVSGEKAPEEIADRRSSSVLPNWPRATSLSFTESASVPSRTKCWWWPRPPCSYHRKTSSLDEPLTMNRRLGRPGFRWWSVGSYSPPTGAISSGIRCLRKD